MPREFFNIRPHGKSCRIIEFLDIFGILLLMESEDREMLKCVLELSESNHKMLKKMHRNLLLHRIFSVLYWALIIGATVGLYYYLQPFFDQVSEIYSGITGVQVDIGEVFNNLIQKKP
ncbi:MAG: hypothetical protein KAR00_01735 [Candidatus Pacebacteria bacterium]|nr:hypothetical protein [Candidatus Paceibacterota bacterium]